MWLLLLLLLPVIGDHLLPSFAFALVLFDLYFWWSSSKDRGVRIEKERNLSLYCWDHNHCSFLHCYFSQTLVSYN